MNSIQDKATSAAASFSAEAIRLNLPPGLEAPGAEPRLAAQLQGYLHCYGLVDLARSADYRIGRLALAGSELVVQRFGQRGPSGGTALLVHGYMDHAGLYRHLVRFLFNRGWDLLLYDLPGHGLSAGEPLAVDSFFHYADQLAALVQKQGAVGQPPLALIGHSTGAAIITTLLAREPALHEQLARRPVLLAPLLRPTHWRNIRRKYRWLGRWLKRVKRVYQQNTHDPEFLGFLRRGDPLQHGYIPVKWIGAMLEWIGWVEQQSMPGYRPLIVQGTDDGTVDWQQNLPVFERIYGGTEVVLVEAGRHNLVNEALPWRDQVFAALWRVLQEEV